MKPDRDHRVDGRPRHDLRRDSIIALSEWLQTPAGQYVMAWEQAHFDTLVADIFGYNAVQIGLLQLPALRCSRMPLVFAAGEQNENSQVSLSSDNSQNIDTDIPSIFMDTSVPRAHAGQLDKAALPLVRTRFEELPFASHSLDLVVLPHTLEFADDPHEVLREVERVLIPEGQVIITGFNPLSLWGARHGVGRAFDTPFLPSVAQFMALPRVKDWLKLLGMEVERGRFGCYRPPFRSQNWLERMAFMEAAGDRWWPVCGAVYLLTATKHVRGMRLVGLARNERRLPRASFAPATPSHLPKNTPPLGES